MSKIAIIEKYALCMLKETKKFLNGELPPHLLVAMIVEMVLEDCLEITDYNTGKIFDSTSKIKVKLNDKEPSNEYNKKLYNYIKEMNKPELAIETIILTICYDFSKKKLITLIDALKEKMINDGLITVEYKKWLFGKKEAIIINDGEFNKAIEEVRTEVLGKEPLTDDMILLASLLNSTHFLKGIFIKYEKEDLKKRLNEIKDTEISKQVKIARYVIDSMDMSSIIATI